MYALARLRPIDITLPIWPAARRCIHMKNPISNTSGSSKLAQLSNQLELGDLASKSTPWFCSSSVWLTSGKLLGAVLVNFSPVVSSPLMLLVELLRVTVLTLPSSTLAQKVLNGTLSELVVGHTLGRANDNSITAKSTGMTHRGHPLPIGRRPPRSGGC